MADNLNNMRVLITRPKKQAEALCELVNQAGGQAVLFPAIEISPAADKSVIFAQLNRLAEYDLAIFISTHAVDQLWSFIKVKPVLWPDSINVAAIGLSTSRRLKSVGVTVNSQPEHSYTTESLLEDLTAKKLNSGKILIIRGVGGRECLADSLREMGAQVDYLEIYQRQKPAIYDSRLLSDWQSANSMIVCTSNEGLSNLLSMAPKPELLLATTLLVVSHRMQKYARQSGFRNRVLISENARNESIMKVLINQRGSQYL